MENEFVFVTIGNREYPLKLSTFAVKDIKERFGSVGKAADDLTDKSKAIFEKLDLAISLVSILATHGARAYNFENPDKPQIPDLPEKIAGTVLTFADLGKITPKIIEAFNIGLGRTVFSMPDVGGDEKN